MKTYAIYLWPRGALASMPGSDMLFGAVCWGIRLLKLADVGKMLDNFDPAQFAFSSPCPVYRRGQAQLRFYPWPAWLALSQADIRQLAQETARQEGLGYKEALVQTTQKAKRLKKLTYLSEKLFKAAVEGHLKPLDLYRRLQPPKQPGSRATDIEQIGPAALSYAERQAAQPEGAFEAWLLQSEAVQHNHIDRVVGGTVEGLLFYDNEIFFLPGAGLWCLLRADESTMNDRVRPALRYLADTGLGANRTAGKGQFDIEVAEAPPLPQAGPEANGLVMLSGYLPRPDEWAVTERPLAYKLTTLTAKRERKFARPAPGQETLPVYKRQVRMLAPGCVVPYRQAGSGIYGQLVEVAPDEGNGWKTWQSGLAIGLPARVEVTDG